MIYSKDIPVRDTPDVLVLGAGPSGLCAAVEAARCGAGVLLAEQHGYSGGMATAGLVAPFMTCFDSGGGEMLIHGLFEEIVNRLCERGDAIHPSRVMAPSCYTSYQTVGHKRVTPFRAEGLKRTADVLLAEAGVTVRYHTSFVDCETDGDRVRRVILLGKEGLYAVEPRFVIDCTGDADAAAAAGVPFTLGNEKNGKIQPATMFFRIGNVDQAAIDRDYLENIENFYRKDGVNYRSLHWWVEKAREAGDWTLDRVSVGLYRGVDPDEWSINTTRIMGIDGTDSVSLTRGEIEGRRQAEEIFRFFVKYVPGCRDAKLLQTGSTLGIRETRHIRGLRTLTVDDLLGCVTPEDSVMIAANSVDIHGKFGPRSNEYIPLPEGKHYGVPYGTMVPVGVSNMLVSGRPISASSDAAGAIRVMPPCMALGQAAGAAAAMAVRGDTSAADVSVCRLRETLTAHGARVE